MLMTVTGDHQNQNDKFQKIILWFVLVGYVFLIVTTAIINGPGLMENLSEKH